MTSTPIRIPYADGRPHTPFRLEATDHGVVLAHGDSPGDCDRHGARDAWVFTANERFYMHYDGAGPAGWLCCLAESVDGIHWEKRGAVLDFGAPSEPDSASASYGTVFEDGGKWHMFYLGTPNASPPPGRVPLIPYSTLRAEADAPTGPWRKHCSQPPFCCQPGTYYADTASPGQVVRWRGEYLMFFAAAAHNEAGGILRTVGIARTRQLDQPWKVDAAPALSAAEQIENSSLYYEPTCDLWFLFTNHVGYDEAHTGADGHEYTDAIWVYWTRDLNHWDSRHKAVVLDGRNCRWSQRCIGLPSVVKIGGRLAVYYDAPRDHGAGHIARDIGLAWLDLPLISPVKKNDSGSMKGVR